jgi:hypothetical protein
MKVNLQVKTNENISIHELKVGEVFTIGRSINNNLKINDKKISSNHCQLYLSKAGLRITDLNSKNGIHLNGIKIEVSEVFVGDHFKIGDTIISLEEKNIDQEAKHLLGFPGSYRARIGHELEVDFSGARNKNQLIHEKKIIASYLDELSFHAKEISLRKKVNSQIKLSKEEIRQKHKGATIISNLIDLFFLVFFISILSLIINEANLQILSEGKKRYELVLTILFGIISFSIINFRLKKFSFGETICGIKKKYLNQ